ncbi:MAG: hypothetical protein JXQ71_01335 [Verrucomicrobia bacterium]|nr:hypothetical protein [Verrucomicrobiota bacterium]
MSILPCPPIAAAESLSPAVFGPADTLVELAAQLEPDGGMPGATAGERVLRSVVALLCFLSQGHTAAAGIFRAHVGRLVAFLGARERSALSAERHEQVERCLELARAGKAPGGDWLRLWKELAEGAHPDADAVWRQLADAGIGGR